MKSTPTQDTRATGFDHILSYATKIMTGVINYVTVFVITRSAGLEVYGMLVIIVSSVGTLTLLSTAKSGEAVPAFYKRYETLGELGKAKYSIRLGVTYDLFFAIVVFLLTIAIAPLIAVHLLKDASTTSFIVLFGVVNALAVGRGSTMSYFLALHKFRLVNIYSVMEIAIRLVLLLGLVASGTELSLSTILVAYVLSAVLVTGFSYCAFYLHIRKSLGLVDTEKDAALSKEFKGFTLKRFTSLIFESGYRQADNLLVGYFISPVVVSVYDIIKKLYVAISYVSIPIYMLNYPRLARLHTVGDKGKFRDVIKKNTIYLFFASVAISLVGTLLMRPVFAFLSIEEIQGQYFFASGVVATLFIWALVWWNRAVSFIMNPSWILHGSILRFLLQLGLGIPLTAMYGLWGLTVANMITATCFIAFWYYVYFRKTNLFS